MSGSCIVAPGYLIADGETLTEAKLRQMAQPTVSVAAGSITDAELNLPAVTAALGTNTRPNLLTNGNFAEPRWAANSISCAAGEETWNAEAWVAKPAGGAVTFAKSTEVPMNALSLHSAEIGGATGVTTCQLGQNIERALSGTLARKVTFSAWIYNNTGASATPQVVLATADTANDWTSLTVQDTTNLTPCPNVTWTKVTAVLDCTTLPNIGYGLRIAVQFPSGSLDSSGKKWNLAQAKLEAGETATDPEPDTQWPRQQAVAGTAAGLVIQNNATNPTYQVDVAADELILKDFRGYAVAVSGLSKTADLTLSGLDGLDTGSGATSTWYYVWAVSDGVDHRVLLSASATAPTLPAGYLYKARLGAVYNGSDNTLATMYQRGRRVFIERTLVFTSKGPTTANTFQSESLAAIVPPIACFAFGTAGTSVEHAPTLAVAANGNGLGATIINGWMLEDSLLGFYGSSPFGMMLITPQTIWWTSQTTNAWHRMEITGYEI